MSSIDETTAGYMVLRDLDATHDRRARLLIIVTSAALIFFGLALFLVFLAKGLWLNCAFESPAWMVGIAGG